MDGGNRAIIYVAVPPPIKMLVILYKNARSKPSFAAALIELLETHPELDRMARDLYAKDNTPTGEAIRP